MDNNNNWSKGYNTGFKVEISIIHGEMISKKKYLSCEMTKA